MNKRSEEKLMETFKPERIKQDLLKRYNTWENEKARIASNA